uniref:Thioesterase domain-containing protein n=1 Tax=Panagrolaimus sp. JU765 TaxID=591449 RepID=A0AC34QW85_9BILA
MPHGRGNLQYFKALEKYWKKRPNVHGFHSMLVNCELISAEPGRIKYEFPVLTQYTNPFGTLHGGCTFTLLDECLSNAIFDPEKHDKCQTGVTISMTISYLNGVRLGEKIIIEAQKLREGKSFAFIEGNVYRKSDGIPVALAQQTLALI